MKAKTVFRWYWWSGMACLLTMMWMFTCNNPLQAAVPMPSDTTKENAWGRLMKNIRHIFSADTSAEKKMEKEAKKEEGATGLRSLFHINRDPNTTPYFGNSPHFNHHRIYKDTALSTEQQWNQLQQIDPAYQPALEVETKGAALHPGIQVFGFHPYWMGSAYQGYMYEYLTTVAYFCYEVEPRTGKPRSVYNWNTTGVIDSVHNHHNKAVLTISSLGMLNNSTFLIRQGAQHKLVSQVTALLLKRKGNGICIDFEDVPGSLKKEFTRFVFMLCDSLHAADTSYQVSMCIPAVDYYGAFDVASLKKKVDYFILLGYDYYSGRSSVAGPDAPLLSSKTWGTYSVDWSVNYYLQLGLPPSRLILGVPYFGNRWQTKSRNMPSDKIGFEGSLPYYALRDEFTSDTFLLDTVSQSQYHFYEDETSTYQVWLDAEKSLDLKYKYVLSKGLAGVAIWTLGYDHGYPELWQLLVDNFSNEAVEAARQAPTGTVTDSVHLVTGDSTVELADTTESAKEDSELGKTLMSMFLRAANDGDLGSRILLILSILAGFFMLGFLVAFSNHTLGILFRERLVLVYLIIFMSLITVIVVIDVVNKPGLSKMEDNFWDNFGLGVIITILFMSIFYFITRQRKQQP